MKKFLLALVIFIPVIAHAACNCDEEEDDDGEYRQYEYVGFKMGDSRPEGILTSQLSNEYGFYYGKRVSALFGYEWSFDHIGEYSAPPDTYKIEALSVSGLHYYDLTESISLWGKLGVAYAQTKGTLPIATSLDLVAGIGFDFELNRNIKFRAGYDINRVSLPDKTNDISSYLGLWAKL